MGLNEKAYYLSRNLEDIQKSTEARRARKEAKRRKVQPSPDAADLQTQLAHAHERAKQWETYAHALEGQIAQLQGHQLRPPSDSSF